jgi:hypothetical protein
MKSSYWLDKDWGFGTAEQLTIPHGPSLPLS